MKFINLNSICEIVETERKIWHEVLLQGALPIVLFSRRRQTENLFTRFSRSTFADIETFSSRTNYKSLSDIVMQLDGFFELKIVEHLRNIFTRFDIHALNLINIPISALPVCKIHNTDPGR